MEKLSLGIFTGAFSPTDNKRYSFKARGAAAAVSLAQLVYNGASTIFFKSDQGYTDIANNYMSWTFHAPKDFKLTANSDTALNCAYVRNNTDMGLPEFFELLANATKYAGEYATGVEVAGWESAMRTLQLAEDKVNESLKQFTSVNIRNTGSTQFGHLYSSRFGSSFRFEAPSGTDNLFSKFMSWLSDTLKDKEVSTGGTVSVACPAYSFLTDDDKRLGVVLEFERSGNTIATMTFTFADYEE